ncbi:BCCT family transporter [Pseudoalteromonas denitrificans]|uniref:Betaine/carnitine transporter, BCCT family n=1 Tax=Pseudoalteromonas denitrificans DSM 6059 TaxID=1123010 RepID=A0A1I1R1Y1_9GAMM|nr:BCCT family transporter [Pseudoalteromonas denitrificans]SFD28319.1 betaine/carnitine transporter, BCCT family [Pseudoalteromonas denitrificans DSM 6059]
MNKNEKADNSQLNGVTKSVYETDHEIGEHNVEIMGMDLHNPVFFSASAFIILFVIFTLLFPESAKHIFDVSKSWSINTFDWLFITSGNLFVVFCLALIVLPLGKIRLGGLNARKQFSTMSWLAMLFSAGMGIGLMFWSVAEPVGYFTNWYGTPLNTPEGTVDAARIALGATMFHWGLHPWAMYAVVGLSLAFFTFNCNMPLTIRSAFFPLLGDRVWRWPGNVIDTVAVLATIFGLATSLGFGAQQAAGGLNFLFGIPNGISTQIAIIFIVTIIAIFSVMRGLEGGVKVLSNINMSLAFILMLFVMIAGSTSVIISGVGTTLLAYVENIIPLSNWIGREDETFYHGWTVFYWAWWVSWSPFVGMFIARISLGRTVREFMLAVLLVPTLLTVVWMSTFGGMGLEQAQNGIGQLANGITDSSLALFQMLENLPLSGLTSFLAIVLGAVDLCLNFVRK